MRCTPIVALLLIGTSTAANGLFNMWGGKSEGSEVSEIARLKAEVARLSQQVASVLEQVAAGAVGGHVGTAPPRSARARARPGAAAALSSPDSSRPLPVLGRKAARQCANGMSSPLAAKSRARAVLTLAQADAGERRGNATHHSAVRRPYCSSPDAVCAATHPPADGIDARCEKSPCPQNSYCFMGKCYCHPGYATPHGKKAVAKQGGACTRRLPLSHSNQWYTGDCPNLRQNRTFDVEFPLDFFGGEFRKGGTTCPRGFPTKSCQYLCFADNDVGVAVVPKSLWHYAQKAEADLWQRIGTRPEAGANDRAPEHWRSFDCFSCLPQGARLGSVIEVGAGPWTQLKGFLSIRPDLVAGIEKFTVWEPSASRYMKEVVSCSYRTGSSLNKNSGGKHPFPVQVISDGGELLTAQGAVTQYDTVMSINVIEHVQDAFKYLSGLYLSLKTGGLLIFHDRYYLNAEITNGDLYHPIRIKRRLLDHFLSGFDVIFNNCHADYEGRKDQGYYVVARKR